MEIIESLWRYNIVSQLPNKDAILMKKPYGISSFECLSDFSGNPRVSRASPGIELEKP